jgi:ribosomal protein S18 acetylase RimI-like enzyme
MSDDSSSKEWAKLEDAPYIPNLRFRHFRGESDYPHMVAVTEGMRQVDQLELTISVDDVAREFKHLENCDPYRDFLLAEVNGKIIGYTRVWWSKDPSGIYLYNHSVDLLPEWREKGIRNAMLRYNEQKLRELAREHPTGVPRLFQSVVMESERDWIAVLSGEGYKIFRYGFKMVRPNLEEVPDLPFPDEIEVRPVKPEHYRAIIRAWNDACKDMRGQIPISDEDFKGFQESPIFEPSIWQIAWQKNEVVGTVLNFIDKQENAQYERKRGHVELISVKRLWRGKGIAKAMIARSLKILKDHGMTEAALGVDAENPSGALHLYQKMGFQIEKRAAFYRKPMN